MLKKILILLIVCIIGNGVQQKASSYDTFDGRYSYQQVGNGTNINVSSMSEEILIILDYSSSMRAKMVDRQRIHYAVSTLFNVLDSLPQNTKIGLRIFGPSASTATLYDTSREVNKINCRASYLISPIQSDNVSNMKSTLSQYTRAEGGTPLTYSLREAINNDFSVFNSFKHIVLITDGKESCGEDPCQYIKRLMQSRNDIRIDVIGISTEENAYSQLSCIAQSANGRLHIVNNVNDLYVSIETAIASVPPNMSPPSVDVNANIGIIDTSMDTMKTTPPREIRYNSYAFEFDI